MDWVETTGRTVAEATAEALAELSVSEEEAEVVVLSEAKPGLFGRVRSEARVRVRLRPATVNRRGETTKDRRRDPRPRVATSSKNPKIKPDTREDVALVADRQVVAAGDSSGRRSAEVLLADQAEVAKEFLVGVLDRFGASASVGVTDLDDGVAELAITGRDLALLVGPRGVTVDALQDLARVVVQRRTGSLQGRLFVDVAGYRKKRRQALEDFTRQRAEEVLRDGLEQVLEPMAPADRKVVHATANLIDGVRTHSEGEEPRRRVVISPASAEH